MVRRSAAKDITDGKISIPMGSYDPAKDQGYQGDPPRRGVYTFKLTEVRKHQSDAGNSSIYWRFRIEDETSPYHGWPFGEQYTNLETTLWKTQQIVYALTGGTEDMDLDLSDTPKGEKSRAKLIAGSRLVRANVYIEAGNGEYEDRPRMGKVMLLDEDAAARRAALAQGKSEDEDDEDDDFETADEYDDDEEVEDEDEDDDEADEEEADEDEEDEDYDEDEDEEDDEDEDEEPEPEPEPEPRRTRRAVGGTAKASTSASKPAVKKAAARPEKKAARTARTARRK